MICKLGPLAVMLMLVAVFAVGCGDDDKSDSSGSDAPAVTATTDDAASDDAATTEETTSDDDLADDPRVQDAIERCKSSIDSSPNVDDDLKSDLQDVCDKIASGDAEEVTEATREVCRKIVESSVPEGDIRDQALDACDQGS